MKAGKKRTLAALVVLAAVFGAGIWIGVSERQINAAGVGTSSPGLMFSLGQNDTAPPSVNMSEFWQAWNLLDQNFVETHASATIPTEKDKVYGAIEGLTASYKDPYTVFFPPQDAKIFNEDVNGSFGGVGMEIDNDSQGALLVVAPLKDSPSQKAGVLTGDIILAIDATSTAHMSSQDAVKLIRGPKGTYVKLTIARKGESKPIIISVMRDTINIPVINSYLRKDGVYVIELYSFSADSANLFRYALRQFVGSGSHDLVLDMRGNPGGYLDAAVNMASYFLPTGESVVTEDFKGKQTNVVNRSFGYNVFANDPNFKMAILVDQGSASAAEILAGALQQHNVAKLVGTRTFGKGSVQQLMELPGGGELKVTIARWLTPNGTSISDGGLTPDLQADRSEADRTAGKDPQMDRAVQYLLTGN